MFWSDPRLRVFFGAVSGAESGKYVIEAPDILRIVAYALPARWNWPMGNTLFDLTAQYRSVSMGMRRWTGLLLIKPRKRSPSN